MGDPPHTTKFQPAPCHSPPSSMVMPRLAERRTLPFRSPAERDVEVVAEELGQGQRAMRRQKSTMLVALYGALKFIGRRMPKSRRQTQRHAPSSRRAASE